MSNPIPGPPPFPPVDPTRATSATPETAPTRTDFNIGEEFGTAKRNLPPAGIVAICIAAVAIVIAVIAFQQRPKPLGSGSIDFVSAVDVPVPADAPKTLLVAVTLTLHNTASTSLWIRTLNGSLVTADGHTYEDEAASAVDLDRYFQGFPALKESSAAPLSPETKLAPGETKKGTIVFSFATTKDEFERRKSLAVTIQPYDQRLPIILK